MLLVFLRHGPAVERKDWVGSDSLRPLTRRGRRRTRRAVAGLIQFLPGGTCVLTSALVRARSTANELARAGRGELPLRLAPWLRPGRLQAALASVPKLIGPSFVVVGHEPELSRVLAWATGLKLPPLKKAGAAAVEFSGEVVAGAGTLRWYLPPRVLRSLTSR